MKFAWVLGSASFSSLHSTFLLTSSIPSAPIKLIINIITLSFGIFSVVKAKKLKLTFFSLNINPFNCLKEINISALVIASSTVVVSSVVSSVAVSSLEEAEVSSTFSEDSASSVLGIKPLVVMTSVLNDGKTKSSTPSTITTVCSTIKACCSTLPSIEQTIINSSFLISLTVHINTTPLG